MGVGRRASLAAHPELAGLPSQGHRESRPGTGLIVPPPGRVFQGVGFDGVGRQAKGAARKEAAAAPFMGKLITRKLPQATRGG